ncbi:MAG: glycoside hydrolase family 15 protein [Phycisphaerae bacterium]
MPRDIPVGNGRLLVTFDDRYQLRDFYFPHVGQENHAGGGACHFGLWTTLPDPAEPDPGADAGDDSGNDAAPQPTGPRPGKLAWTSDPAWRITQRYLRDTLTTSVFCEHDELQTALYCNDVVDFHRRVHVRRIKVKNRASVDRAFHLMHHQNYNMYGTRIGDTAYYDPDLRAMVHYRAKRYISTAWFSHGEQRIDEYATGTSGFGGAEGTWRDAEDGHLQGNPIAQGAVDSTVSLHVSVPAGGEEVVFFVQCAAESREELAELHKWLLRQTPQHVVDRTTSYWRLWTGGTNLNFGDLPPRYVELIKRSLLIVRSQCDNAGAIIAANDSDIMQFARDTYSYMWPRDGALVADALDLAGFPDLARNFYLFCQRTITDAGYFLHKYNPDGSLASSWHPWVLKGHASLPIQEDETALVVWALWRHYYRYRDIEFVRPLWMDVIVKAADFMCDFRDPRTGLPLPSYDLWEERWGVHAFTVGTVYGGLQAARNFAVCFGDRMRAEKYAKAAAEVKAGAEKHLWSEKLGRFVRRLVPIENAPDTATETAELFEVDETLDAALFALYKFNLFDATDPRIEATMKAIEEELWIKTDVGGVARYANDYYHRISDDIERVPGNPWFICTLWLADFYIARAQTREELRQAVGIFEWTVNHTLPSGVLAEQVHPFTNEPLSVSPLTWSHATVVSTAIKYLEKLEQLSIDETGRAMFQMRRAGPVEIANHVQFDLTSAGFVTLDPSEIGHEEDREAGQLNSFGPSAVG